jgi:KaiC/GvpD/RAD55 family RecA-like ATPase
MLIAGTLDVEEDCEVIQGVDIETMMEKRSDKYRIPMLPNILNEALEGGPSRGHHIVVYSVTDMGKTLFTLNAIRGFLKAGHKVVYVCNEDPMADLVERLLVSICSEMGKDKWDIRKHPRQASMYAKKQGWDNLVWAALAPGTLGQIRAIVEEHRPDVLIVDQIRNLDTGDKNFVRILEVAAQGMRNFAKRYNLLSISVTQAGDSANGKAILNRGDIDNSNVGIPGTADLMLGIGATEDQEYRGERVFSFAKNKVSGNKTPIPVLFNMKSMRVE